MNKSKLKKVAKNALVIGVLIIDIVCMAAIIALIGLWLSISFTPKY